MKAKCISIKSCKSTDGVSLTTIKNKDSGIISVLIQAWHRVEGDSLLQKEIVEFGSELMASRFISDFSNESAYKFADSFSI